MRVMELRIIGSKWQLEILLSNSYARSFRPKESRALKTNLFSKISKINEIFKIKRTNDISITKY